MIGTTYDIRCLYAQLCSQLTLQSVRTEAYQNGQLVEILEAAANS